MKILFLTSRFPYPLDKGDKLRAFFQIKELSKQHDVYLVSIVDEDIEKNDLEELRTVVKKLYILRIRPIDRFWSLCKAFFSGQPFQTAWFYCPKLDNEVKKIVSELEPNHVLCQLARMAPYCKGIDVPASIDYMDAFGIGMLRRSYVATGFSKFVYRFEAKRMIQYEAKIADWFEHRFIISEQDREQLSIKNKADVQVMSNGINPDFFTKLNRPKHYDIVFVGNMGYLPNIEAAEYLVNEILPQCQSQITVLISGTQPAQRVKSLGSPQVNISGWVKDIRESYCSAKIFVAPLWSGTGQQNKILEAMALGIPCITTTMVNNAIGATPNHQILIADDAVSFANMIALILNDTQLYQEISTSGTTFVKQKYDWVHNGKILSDIFAQN